MLLLQPDSDASSWLGAGLGICIAWAVLGFPSALGMFGFNILSNLQFWQGITADVIIWQSLTHAVDAMKAQIQQAIATCPTQSCVLQSVQVATAPVTQQLNGLTLTTEVASVVLIPMTVFMVWRTVKVFKAVRSRTSAVRRYYWGSR